MKRVYIIFIVSVLFAAEGIQANEIIEEGISYRSPNKNSEYKTKISSEEKDFLMQKVNPQIRDIVKDITSKRYISFLKKYDPKDLAYRYRISKNKDRKKLTEREYGWIADRIKNKKAQLHKIFYDQKLAQMLKSKSIEIVIRNYKRKYGDDDLYDMVFWDKDKNKDPASNYWFCVGFTVDSNSKKMKIFDAGICDLFNYTMEYVYDCYGCRF